MSMSAAAIPRVKSDVRTYGFPREDVGGGDARSSALHCCTPPLAAFANPNEPPIHWALPADGGGTCYHYHHPPGVGRTRTSIATVPVHTWQEGQIRKTFWLAAGGANAVRGARRHALKPKRRLVPSATATQGEDDG
jgi:hypothetical protein